MKGCMKVIGLTGGIGTGKSVVAQILQELGAEVISADQIGHEVYQPGTEAWQAVVAAFGEDILRSDVQIDRKKLGALVFANPSDRVRLNDILHPRMRLLVQERLHQLQERGAAVAVVEAAILIEAGWDSLVDDVWVVTAPQEEVIQRLVRRDTMTEKEIWQRMQAQITPQQQEKRAHVIIDNTGDLPQLRSQVQALWQDRVSRKD